MEDEGFSCGTIHDCIESIICQNEKMSGGQLLEIRLLDTFGSKSTARHKIYQLLESS